MFNYNDWMQGNEVTVRYQWTVEIDGKIKSGTREARFLNDKQADTTIAEWNRLAALTKGAKWFYRRLS